MRADINTKSLQGSLFNKTRSWLMGVDDNYDDDIEKHYTHPDLLPQESQECATTVSEKTKKMLANSGAFRKVMGVTQTGLPNATRKTQVAVSAVVLKTMARRTDKSSSHHRSVLGGKGNAIRPRSIRQTDVEDNAYERMYTRAKAEVAYIDVDWRFRSRLRFCFHCTRYCRFRFRFCRTRYCPVHMKSLTQVVRPRNIDRLDRLCQTGVISCKWTRKLTYVQ